MNGLSYHESLHYASYYAPYGRRRLYLLGGQLAQRYLKPTDHLIGVIGPDGSGKSTLIRGLFPGLELTNDDQGVHLRPGPIFKLEPNDFFAGHTFHLDARFESAFHQKHEIVQAVNKALELEKRVIIEHFDLLFDQLGYNAQVLFGIGEEVLVCRPSVFGPFPDRIKKNVDRTIRFRLMAHSAEDITLSTIKKLYPYLEPYIHIDVRHGFVVSFREEPGIRPAFLEKEVKAIIARDMPLSQVDSSHIRIGEEKVVCTSPRIHVKTTGQIEGFRLFRNLKYDPIHREYNLVGMVGRRDRAWFDDHRPRA